MEETLYLIIGILIYSAMLGLYFLPTIISAHRKHRTLAVFLINLLAGWSIVGWIVALVIACEGEQENKTIEQPKRGRPRKN